MSRSEPRAKTHGIRARRRRRPVGGARHARGPRQGDEQGPAGPRSRGALARREALPPAQLHLPAVHPRPGEVRAHRERLGRHGCGHDHPGREGCRLARELPEEVHVGAHVEGVGLVHHHHGGPLPPVEIGRADFAPEAGERRAAEALGPAPGAAVLGVVVQLRRCHHDDVRLAGRREARRGPGRGWRRPWPARPHALEPPAQHDTFVAVHVEEPVEAVGHVCTVYA